MSSLYNRLFSKGNLGASLTKNRFIVAPMTRVSADENGVANETMEKYYERFAKGGFGVIITEGIYTDKQYSQGYLNQPGIVDKEQTEAWRKIVKTVHNHGSLMIAQLMHAGGQSQGNAYQDTTKAPSDVAPKGDQLGFYGGSGSFPVPGEMTIEDIEAVKKSFVESALNAKEAGFEGVEIHGANGYLLDQFLTDYLNHREDEYGGSLEYRLRLLTEVIHEVRSAVGDNFVVGIRISQGKVADQSYKWPEGQAAAETIFTSLGKTELDYIHTTDGDGSEPSFGEDSMTLAEAATSFSQLPVIANGQLRDPSKAEVLLQKEQAEFISLGTSALANPDLPNKVEKGLDFEEFEFEKILLPQAYVKKHELEMNILE
ncbi:NADH:flavin oxidoreductase [Rossellomorea sp. y25]|uniref:NADH:flavin oxidoreductase n=1 Tax=Rossellomorea sp. y25 TaxID=3118174 RepID=UPI0030E0037C